MILHLDRIKHSNAECGAEYEINKKNETKIKSFAIVYAQRLLKIDDLLTQTTYANQKTELPHTYKYIVHTYIRR